MFSLDPQRQTFALACTVARSSNKNGAYHTRIMFIYALNYNEAVGLMHAQVHKGRKKDDPSLTVETYIAAIGMTVPLKPGQGQCSEVLFDSQEAIDNG